MPPLLQNPLSSDFSCDPSIIHFWLLSFPRQTGYFNLYLGCKDLFVLTSTHVQIHCCLALVQEWMGSGRDTQFSPACPILLFFSTAMALIACAMCPKMPFLLPTWTTDECFIFHKDFQTEFVVNLSWSDSEKEKKIYIALPTLNPSASIGDYYGGFVSQTMACFFLSHFSFFSSSYAPSSSSNVSLPHSLCRHIE